ncbi:thermonuclease family protein [Aeromicrobium wangtongii]|uniref:Thermonuclease family protein n=1 Tax=Aeromicrobium wangtongii TaxID=2969247 RepID=A0ABY5M8Y6_9ACTN|nr:thermonuclease family protein [Aeromicrobium wangtongii]MCD9197104.1 thermonuclease family protein [Aeromicrobium wangtongii]UUP14603.1 thermonuclease family protein [Aeromicrobium wangtongii]
MTPLRGILASALATVLVGASMLVAAPAQAADMDCSDFATQADAQAFYLANGGPAADPHRLDAEGDGLACETLPCPCSKLPAPPPPTTAPVSPCGRNPKVVEKAVVLSVIDGDTLRVRIDGRSQKVRLLGINSPERKKKGYASATKALKKLAPPRKTVALISDPTQKYADRYGRILRYVERGSRDVNKAQLSKGWAKYSDVRTCAPLVKKKTYKSAEHSAKKAKRGIWK